MGGRGGSSLLENLKGRDSTGLETSSFKTFHVLSRFDCMLAVARSVGGKGRRWEFDGPGGPLFRPLISIAFWFSLAGIVSELSAFVLL
jgi:hypothetical protein